MSPRTPLVAAGLVLAGAAGAAWWWFHASAPGPVARATASPVPEPAVSPAPPRTSATAEPPQEDGGRARPRFGSEEGRRRRAEMLEKIVRRIGEAPSEPPAAANERGASEDEPVERVVPNTLAPAYVKQVVREEFIPLARECFDAVLEDRPDFEGKTIIRFTIAGDEEVGGVVEDAEEVGSDLPPEMGECLVESMMSMTFEPPEGRGRLTIEYPFWFFGE